MKPTLPQVTALAAVAISTITKLFEASDCPEPHRTRILNDLRKKMQELKEQLRP
jgi:hypothetical protein